MIISNIQTSKTRPLAAWWHHKGAGGYNVLYILYIHIYIYNIIYIYIYIYACPPHTTQVFRFCSDIPFHIVSKISPSLKGRGSKIVWHCLEDAAQHTLYDAWCMKLHLAF